MIQVRIIIDEGHSYIEVSGHAEAASTMLDSYESTSDCSAVSAIMQNAALGLMAMALTHPKNVEIKKCVMPKGTVRMMPPDDDRAEATGTE